MAVTIAQVRKLLGGDGERANYVDITGPASYTTGGEALTQANLDQLIGDAGSKIGDITYFGAEASTAGHEVVLDRTNSKVMYWNGTTQIANATNLSAVTVRVRIAKAFKP